MKTTNTKTEIKNTVIEVIKDDIRWEQQDTNPIIRDWMKEDNITPMQVLTEALIFAYECEDVSIWAKIKTASDERKGCLNYSKWIFQKYIK